VTEITLVTGLTLVTELTLVIELNLGRLKDNQRESDLQL